MNCKIILKDIKARCNNINCKAYKNYGERGIKCLITIDEIKKLWFRDKAYLQRKPSIDRKENNGHYEYSNCRFIELSENVAERNKRVSSKITLQYDLNENFIKEWYSSNEAGRQLNIFSSSICKCCNNNRKTAGGFIWRYKEKEQK